MSGSPARVLPALLGLALAAGLLALSCSHDGKRQEPRSAVPQSPPGDPIVSFETVRIVLQSPRCVNCHPVGDAPLQGDDGHVHLQNIQRGSEGRGIPGLNCAACHGKANPPESYGPNAPPGVSTDWHLPPADMKMVPDQPVVEGLAVHVKPHPSLPVGRAREALVRVPRRAGSARSATSRKASRDLRRLGTPFFTTREGGTGLGVMLARAVVAQHGEPCGTRASRGREPRSGLRSLAVRLPARAQRPWRDPRSAHSRTPVPGETSRHAGSLIGSPEGSVSLAWGRGRSQ